MLEELANQYKGELLGFEPNQEKASEMASDEVVLEDPQQHKPNSQMASNTCSDLIIHPDFQPYHLNATHSNISFGIALRNLAFKNSLTHLTASDKDPSLSEESTLVVQPLSVVLPSEATLNTKPEHENSTRPYFMITSDSDDENEQTNQWFRPGFLNQPLSSSSTCVLEYIHDPPLTSSQIFVAEHTITDLPCSSNQICPQTLTTNISPPPTILLDSTILQEVCENIFKDLNKLVMTRSNLVHKESYVDQWTSLRERIDYVMNELQKSSLKAHSQALKTLQDWFKEVVNSMEEVNINRNQEFNKLYLSDTYLHGCFKHYLFKCAF